MTKSLFDSLSDKPPKESNEVLRLQDTAEHNPLPEERQKAALELTHLKGSGETSQQTAHRVAEAETGFRGGRRR